MLQFIDRTVERSTCSPDPQKLSQCRAGDKDDNAHEDASSRRPESDRNCSEIGTKGRHSKQGAHATSTIGGESRQLRPPLLSFVARQTAKANDTMPARNPQFRVGRRRWPFLEYAGGTHDYESDLVPSLARASIINFCFSSAVAKTTKPSHSLLLCLLSSSSCLLRSACKVARS